MHGWVGRPQGRPWVFPRPPFPMMQFARSMSNWTMTAPPWATMPPKDFAERLEAARQAVSQTQGGFGAPSRLAYKPTASALPQEQLWNAPSCKRPDPRKMLKKQPAAVMPSPLKQLPHDWILPQARPKFALDIADLQGPTAGGTGQQDMEENMDLSGSHISPSEVCSEGRSEHSEMPAQAQAALEMQALEHVVFDETASERNDRQAWETAYIGFPDTIQDDNGEEDESDSEEDDNEEDKEESKTSLVVEAKSTMLSGGRPEERGIDG